MRPIRILLALFWLLSVPLAQAETVAHTLDVTLRPEQGEIEARDTITLPAPAQSLLFTLHEALEPAAEGGRLEAAGRASNLPWRRWRLTLPAPGREFTVRYRGRIVAPPRAANELHATAGHIGPEGVFLSALSGWYPDVEGLLTFRLDLHFPPGWQGVSQGRSVGAGWEESQPQEEIALAANRFHLWRRPTPWGEAQVFLLADEPAVAERYLAATARYLELYSRLIGPYPYAKFALVENFWESGYGMPSFTLLGGKVLRLPFILTSSYPHEILHNWWGNGVYVDFERGNWGEGLTAYLADHLLAEERGEGENYRRDLLKKYAEYAAHAEAIPLTDFRSRHSEATQAVGYGKSAMVFHMLRRRLDDERFVAALQRLWREKRFQTASWADLRAVFEAEAGTDLKPFFEQWVERAGAPALELAGAVAQGQQVRFELAQSQPGAPYRIEVPYLIGRPDAAPLESHATLAQRREQVTVDAGSVPTALAIDPAFDLFRRLDRSELPPSFDGLFARDEPLFVLPTDAGEALLAAYRAFAATLGGRGAQLRLDRELPQAEFDRLLAAGRTVWLLGWENRLLPGAASALARDVPDAPVLIAAEPVRIAGREVGREEATVALAHRFGFVATTRAAALPGLARKLPHYGKYGQLLFRGDAPENVAKGEWRGEASALTHRFAEGATPEVPRRRPLSALVASP